jgi:tRNA 2-thiocytidine biosynthesis protein TtcA
MLREWEKKFPGRLETMFTALQNVVPSHLMDNQRFDFKRLKTTGIPDEAGDTAFDAETFNAPVIPGLQVISA